MSAPYRKKVSSNSLKSRHHTSAVTLGHAHREKKASSPGSSTQRREETPESKLSPGAGGATTRKQSKAKIPALRATGKSIPGKSKTSLAQGLTTAKSNPTSTPKPRNGNPNKKKTNSQKGFPLHPKTQIHTNGKSKIDAVLSFNLYFAQQC